jgi:hypothetical protein
MPAAKRKVPKPAVVDPFDETVQVYKNAKVVHDAYNSGWACESCGAPVLPAWDRCPACSGQKMLKSDDPRRKSFSPDTLNVPAHVVETVTVKESKKDAIKSEAL